MSQAAAHILLQDIAALKARLVAVRQEIQSGTMPTLTGLEAQVVELCTRAQDAAPDLRPTLVTELTALVKDLDACEKDLHDWYDRRKGVRH